MPNEKFHEIVETAKKAEGYTYLKQLGYTETLLGEQINAAALHYVKDIEKPWKEREKQAQEQGHDTFFAGDLKRKMISHNDYILIPIGKMLSARIREGIAAINQEISPNEMKTILDELWNESLEAGRKTLQDIQPEAFLRR